MATYCYRHYCNYNRNGDCPECLKDERERTQENRHQEMIEAIESLRDSNDDDDNDSGVDASELADEMNNPGDWECPWCFYYTLQYRAWRCPKCHAQFSQDYHRQYWSEVDDEIREDEEIAAEEKAKRETEVAQAQASARVQYVEQQAAIERQKRLCIATVCFGATAFELFYLRKWRDQMLSQSLMGVWFIGLYYSDFGYTFAHWIEDKNLVKSSIRHITRLLIRFKKL